MKMEPIRNKEDVKKIKDLATGRNKLMLEVGFNTGLRISDILQITAGDIKSSPYIYLTEKKTKKSRKVTLPDKVRKMALEYIEENNIPNDYYLFQSREGENKAISDVQAYRIIRKLAKKAGLNEKVGTHTMRKTFGFHYYRQFKDVARLQHIFNHSSPEVTLEYIGITQYEVDESMKEFYI